MGSVASRPDTTCGQSTVHGLVDCWPYYTPNTSLKRGNLSLSLEVLCMFTASWPGAGPS